eukprot:5072130-Ditylum_brightwellii.AAC.1
MKLYCNISLNDWWGFTRWNLDIPAFNNNYRFRSEGHSNYDLKLERNEMVKCGSWSGNVI